MFSELLREGIYYTELIAAVVASLTYKYYKNTPNKLFLPFLWMVFLFETFNKVKWYHYRDYDGTLMTFLRKIFPEGLLAENIWTGNLYTIINFLIYIIYYYLLSRNETNKKILMWILSVFVVCTGIDIWLNYNDFNVYFLNIITVSGSITFFIATIVYLSEIFNSNDILDFHKTLNFWIVFGALIFHLGTAPIFIFGKEFSFSHDAYNYILSIFNYILYGSFVIGFIINMQQQKRSL
ncbi:hypothetical protein GWK08_10740 [Leptobacterium flavescens]|uniref:Uncharacterized protein n=1 Tax=Leptobacterium flavescens TaxID=472055 RepID=A0A6P0UQ17_9FLAO|nr:hypothetical protein [Leptobacterium flavescens]NER13919.1 hypothetical protein [Leptobacterium flavescens]